jgi:hypothetical protein
MRKLAALVVVCGWMAAGAPVVRGAEQTWTGTISDSLCGMSHDAMRKNGQKITDRECTVACVNYQTPGAPKFVFVTGGKVYPIKNQAFGGLGRRSGAPIVLTGDLDSTGEITITKIEEQKKR